MIQSRRNSMGATSTSTEDSEPVGDVISAQPSSVEHLDDDLRRLPGAQPVRQVISHDYFEHEDLKFPSRKIKTDYGRRYISISHGFFHVEISCWDFASSIFFRGLIGKGRASLTLDQRCPTVFLRLPQVLWMMRLFATILRTLLLKASQVFQNSSQDTWKCLNV